MVRPRSSPRAPAFALSQRAAGVLLHPTSLPGPHGCGDLGPSAYEFADWLAAAGQRWWQMLPIGPVGPGGSPYSSPSAFAGNPLLVSLELLAQDGLLKGDELADAPPLSSGHVHYAAAERDRRRTLRVAFERFTRSRASKSVEFDRFRQQARPWLDDWTLFRALADAHGTSNWTRWPRSLRRRAAGALREARLALADAIAFQAFVQYAFHRQWSALRAYCHGRGVGLIGDIPIFVIHESADVWAHPDLFELNADGTPRLVSGVPPDYFSRTGQLWGHPLYRWAAHERSGFGWWLERFAAAGGAFDAVRIDHFLGFNRCWAVPAGHKTALRGTWRPSPGRALLERLTRSPTCPEIIAEDLGAVVPEAVALRERFELPGMRILQFGFGEGARSNQPHNYPPRCVAYTGTHDNETFAGWFKCARRDRRRGRDGLTAAQRAMRYLDCDGREIHRAALRALYLSPANLVVCPIQDVLGLDNRARMNTPATTRGNWRWRLAPGALRAEHAAWLRSLAETYERIVS
jgi:4-alpha-glucanotransferase